MSLIDIAGGTFNWGTSFGPADQRPVREVTLSGYSIGKFEVTVGQYRMFLNETSWRSKFAALATLRREHDSLPVAGVSWLDAQAFSIWLSRREGAVYRLPTEAEWEHAARGDSGYIEPWGNQAGRPQETGNWGRTGYADLRAAVPPVRPVGSYQSDRSPFGLFDMAGNVAEWCLDEYDPNYYSRSPSRNPRGPVDLQGVKVMRGGAWNDPGSQGFAVRRSHAAENQAYTGYGFRIVREPQR